MTDRQCIVLLGGAGFMGRALASRLHASGHEVHVVARGTVVETLEGVHAHGGGMENIDHLRGLFSRADTVVHLASATTPGLSRRAPMLEASGNIAPTLAILQELQQHPRTRLVFLSSGGTVYGNPGSHGATEQTPANPLSYYAAGKFALETFLRTFAHLAGNRVVVLRPSNIYGPGQPMYQGFGVIRTMLQHLADGTTMEIWGDGSVVRDFIHVDDMVAAIECVLRDREAGGTFNVGSGVGHSLNDIRMLAEAASGRTLDVSYAPSRSIDVARIVLDSTALQDRFGWKARVNLAEGIRQTWDWLCTQ